MSELRWNPISQEWVVTATHRQNRTYKPPANYCPLCPTQPGAFPTEVPAANYDIVVFENRFPSFQRVPPPPAVAGDELTPVAPAEGLCEVVLYSPEHHGSLAESSLDRIQRLVRVWVDRFRELGSRPFVHYVLIFENKGDVIGVTLEHPHGQIYAFPFIPPRPALELKSSGEYWQQKGRCLFCDLLARDEKDGRRLVATNDSFVAFVPFAARYPYEVHLMPRRHIGSLLGLTQTEQDDLAALLKVVTLKYDHLFGFSLPYMMIMHQTPTDGRSYPGYHFHIEFYPLHRTATKLKYLAGCESGAGTFINDTLPEEKAAELRALSPHGLDDLTSSPGAPAK